MTQESPFELLLIVSRIQHRVPRRTVSAHPAVQFRLLAHFRIFLPNVRGSLLLPVWVFLMPGISRPLPPVSGFPGFPGETLLPRVLRVHCPSFGIGNLSAYPLQGASEVPALLIKQFLHAQFIRLCS